MISKALLIEVFVTVAVTLVTMSCAEHLNYADIQYSFRFWNIFKERFNKTYASQTDEWNRFLIFTENHKFIKSHNYQYRYGISTFAVEINEHADMSRNEREVMLGLTQQYVLQMTKQNSQNNTFYLSSGIQLPENLDWRQHDMVTGVQEQRSCGACWAFSATGSLEGQYKRKTGLLVPLSQQNLIDCAETYGANGCSGGTMNQAFRYIMANGGINPASAYPYNFKVTEGKCRFNNSNVAAKVKGYTNIPPGREDILQDAVAHIGPISAGIDASQLSFISYHGGIYMDSNCDPLSLNHAVLIVGYNTSQEGFPYWIVKNSYGTRWGEDGYFRLAKDRSNHCGIATLASYPIV